MRIEFHSGKAKDNPKLRDLDRIKHEDYTILSISLNQYIQCCKLDDPPWGYILEYHDGSDDDHYRAIGGPIGVDRILDAFTKYLEGDTSWEDDFTWGKMIHTGHGYWTVKESVRPPHWNALRDKEFEWFLKEVFERLGYHVEMTKASGDQGVDLIVSGDDRRIAVQAKGYANKVGNDAVQQVYAGMKYYNCGECAVITNNRFSSAARDLAKRVKCILIDRDAVEKLMAGRHPWAMSIRDDAPPTLPDVGQSPKPVAKTESPPPQPSDGAQGCLVLVAVLAVASLVGVAFL